MKTWEVAVAVLRETNNPAVMWGDSGLLDTIHARAGLQPCDWPPNKRWAAVLNSLSRSPGILIEGATKTGRRRVRIFYLPEGAPAHLRNPAV